MEELLDEHLSPELRSLQAVEEGVAAHFGRRSFEELGHGSFASFLASRFADRISLVAGASISPEELSAFMRRRCPSSSSRPSGDAGFVCRMDAVIPDWALAGQAADECDATRVLEQLESAPLLVDLAEWCHWDIRFAAQHGHIEAFIVEHQRPHVMEVSLDQHSPTSSPPPPLLLHWGGC
jgi:hypothetical protein